MSYVNLTSRLFSTQDQNRSRQFLHEYYQHLIRAVEDVGTLLLIHRFATLVLINASLFAYNNQQKTSLEHNELFEVVITSEKILDILLSDLQKSYHRRNALELQCILGAVAGLPNLQSVGNKGLCEFQP